MVKTVAVLSALRKESLAFFELGGEEPCRRCGVELARRSVAGLDVVAAAGGMGTINAAASAQLLIDACQPDVLLFCGIAGSLNPRIGQGDVVVGEVSKVNDDTRDNRFLLPTGRFPAIEEDEAPYRLLCTEYPSAPGESD